MPVSETGLRQHVGGLYAEHRDWLLGWLRRKLGHVSGGSEAADLAQDTFLRILDTRGRQIELPTPVDLREPRAYLTTIAKRVLLNHIRRLTLEQSYLDAIAALPEALEPSHEERMMVLEVLNQVDAMLDALPAKVRAAFLHCQLDGMTYGEIAVRLEVSERTVKRYMAQAIEECVLLAQ